MKKLAIILLSILSVNIVNAQRKISADETSYSFKSGKQTAIKVIVYETDAKTVSKKWESLMKDYKAKTSGNKEEVFAENALIKELNNNNAADIYAGFIEDKDGNTLLYVAVDLGGAWLSSSSHKEAYKVMKKITEDFARKVSEETVSDQIKDAEKVFSGLESDQKKLMNDNEKLKKDIENYKEKIKKAEEDIKTNEGDQEKKKKEIEDQLKVIEGLKDKKKSIN